ncbi:MAG: hypothetical protein V3T61_09800 [Acidobacteriota bacterium]
MRNQLRESQGWMGEKAALLLGNAPIRAQTFVSTAPVQESLDRAVDHSSEGPSPDEDWKLDDQWTAITAYLAEMYFPNEG